MADSNNDWARVKDLVADALELAPESREAFLSEQCTGDTQMLEQAKELLGSFGAASDFLEQPALADLAFGAGLEDDLTPGLLDELPAMPVGTIIGAYRIESTLGEGGFGMVYLAHQEKPVRRDVALKVIKPGMDSRSIISRFAQERQALERMDHPNIARVLDAGTTDNDRPYFVMERVSGIPVTQYCSKHELSVDERVELFTQICAAIQHAHQKGVIHRDLKPSNVLVETHEGNPLVKVIDFGIAKAVEEGAEEKSMQTLQGQMVGTPAYMSPEQATGNPDIDTRTDVYSLGVLLYEIVTGERPFSSAMLREAGISEMQRIIREVDPPRPSTRIATAVREGRSQETATLQRSLKGDLDWIIMKALEKQRDRRYESAAALSEDLQRHLQDQPVLAGPPTTSYRFAKFARRNRVALLASGVVLAALIGGLGLALYGFNTASQQRDLAQTAKENESDQRQNAEESLELSLVAQEKSEAVVKFLTDMLNSAQPQQLGRDVLVRDVLDNSANALDQVETPQVLSHLLYTIGTTYYKLGVLPEAHEHLSKSLAMRLENVGPSNMVTLRTQNYLSQVLEDMGQLEEANELLQETYATALEHLGVEHYETTSALQNLGQLASRMGNYPLAIERLDKALGLLEQNHPEQHQSFVGARTNLGLAYAQSGQLETALEHYTTALEGARKWLGEDNVDAIGLEANLLALNYRMENLDGAQDNAERILAWRQKHLGNEHEMTLQSLSNLGVILLKKGNNAEAEPILTEVLRVRKVIHGEEHPGTVVAMANLASAMGRNGKTAEKEALLRTTVELDRKVRGEDHPEFYKTLHSLGAAIEENGDPEAAEPIFREAMQGTLRLLGPDHEQSLRKAQYLAGNLFDSGKYEQLLEAIDPFITSEGRNPNEEFTLYLESKHSQALYKLERYDEALKSFRSLLANGEKSEDFTTNCTGLAHEGIGLCLRALEPKSHTIVEEHWTAAWHILCKQSSPESKSAQRVAKRMIEHYSAKNLAVEAELWASRLTGE